MNTNIEAKLRQIERASRVVRGVCTGLFIAVVTFGLAASIAALAGWATNVNLSTQSIQIVGLGLGPRIAVAALILVTAIVYLKALHHLRRLSTNYTRREVFTLDSARQIRQFGVSCILLGVMKIVWAFLPLAISAGPRVQVVVTSDTILIGVAIVGISWFAEMATALREENELTI